MNEGISEGEAMTGVKMEEWKNNFATMKKLRTRGWEENEVKNNDKGERKLSEMEGKFFNLEYNT